MPAYRQEKGKIPCRASEAISTYRAMISFGSMTNVDGWTGDYGADGASLATRIRLGPIWYSQPI